MVSKRDRVKAFLPAVPGAASVHDEAVVEALRALVAELRSIVEERPSPTRQEVVLSGPVQLAEPLVASDPETRAALAMFAAGLDRLADAVSERSSDPMVTIADEQLDRIAATVLAAVGQPTVDLDPLLQAVKGIKFPQMSVGGGELREVKLRNTSDVNVNPATKESVDAVTTAVQALPQTQALTDTQLRAADVKVTLDGEAVPVTGTFWQATQPVSTVSLPLPAGAATETTLALIKAQTDLLPNVRTRDENVDYLYFDANGVTSVAAGTWVTLASITVPTGTTLRLINAEGDLADLSGVGNGRAIRIRQAGTVMAAALTGSDQPNPDIVGLTLTNSSGSNETWDIQGRHNDAINPHDMAGLFCWVDVT